MLKNSLLSILILLISLPAFSIEGMWPFNRLCSEKLLAEFGFEPTPEWTEHLMLSSVKIGGGSGSFVSASGLVLTNQHVAANPLQQISDAENDYLGKGFYAHTIEEERKIPLLEVKQLLSIIDVTERVKAAVTSDMTDAEALAAKKAVISQIEKESLEVTGLQSEVVSLYRGEIYDLYRYKIYTDVRVVFAPENMASFFGGDRDNFFFPRYALDVALFRVYENGKPARMDHFLKWSADGASQGELIFVSGSPASTERSLTVSALEFLRDIELPNALELLYRRIGVLNAYAEQSPEYKRQAQSLLKTYNNSHKRLTGRLEGLKNPELMERKQAFEEEVRKEALRRDLILPSQSPWEDISTARKAFASFETPYRLLEEYGAFNSELFAFARTLVRLGDELPKDNSKRLVEYQDAKLETLRTKLFSIAPIYPELEIVKLTDSLEMLEEKIPTESHLKPLISLILAGKSPHERARELIEGSLLTRLSERQKLYEGGKIAIEASPDSMIQMAKLVDETARTLRQQYENEVQAIESRAYPLITRALFAIYGTALPPDGTLTPRLSIGTVEGFIDNGVSIPPFTHFADAFEKEVSCHSAYPYCLPRSFHDAKDRLNLTTPYNFVADTDTAAGNSGSPAVNRAGELVGLNFDSNQLSFPGAYLYDQTTKRSILVHSSAILEALQNIYGMDFLYREITGSLDDSLWGW